MIQILYRIYQVEDSSLNNNEIVRDRFHSISKQVNTLLTMDCMVCDDRESFKTIIRDLYGPGIKFAYSKKLKVGDVYCCIIGELTFHSERYFSSIKYTCAHCGYEVNSLMGFHEIISDATIKNRLFSDFEKYSKLKFCSNDCLNHYINNEELKAIPNVDNNFIVNKSDFDNKDIIGYIYKIIKIDSGEEYIGQSIYMPMWRWLQHMKTDRFPESDLLNYRFEVLEIVFKNTNILEREKHHIQESIDRIGNDKCLNVVHNK